MAKKSPAAVPGRAGTWQGLPPDVADLRAIATCFEVTDDVVDAALRPAQDMNDASPRERVFALLEHMCAIARPKQGSPRILRVLARVAGCDWVDGQLEVRVVSHGATTGLELFVNDGLSLTKMRGPLELAVPYDELRKAIASKPELVRPLLVAGHVGATKTRLVAQSLVGATMPPLSAADAELFSASPLPPPRAPTRRPPRRAPSVAPPRRPQHTILGFAEPPNAVLGKVILAKRSVPATREPKGEGRPAPKSTGSATSSAKRPPKSPRRP